MHFFVIQFTSTRMYVIQGKKKVRCWPCLICKNKKNMVTSNKCQMCRVERQNEKMTIAYGGSLYLCKVHPYSHSVSVLRVFPKPEIGFNIMLAMDSTNLRECVEEGFETSEEVKEIIATGTLMSRKKTKSEANVIIPLRREKSEFEAIISTNHPKSLFDQVISSAKTLVYDLNVGQYIEKSDIVQVDANGKIITQFSTTTAALMNSNESSPDTTFAVPPAKDTFPLDHRQANASPTPSPVPMSPTGVPGGSKRSAVGELQVTSDIEDLREVADMVNLSVTSAHPQVRNNVAHHLVDISSSSSSYMHKMEEQKASLEKAMCISIKAKSKGGFGADSHRSKRDVTRKVPCGLCGHKFPECELLGKVSHRGIMRWRQDHKTEVGFTDATLKPENLYESTMICLFCLQFFDEKTDSSFGDVMEETAAIEEMVFGDKRSEADRVLMCPTTSTKKKPKKKQENMYSKRGSSCSSVSSPNPICLEENKPSATTVGESAFSLLHKKPDPVRASILNDQPVMLKSSGGVNKPVILPLRPLSRMADEMTKTKLQIRNITSGTVAAGLAPGSVASTLRSKYTSVSQIMKAQYAAEREDRELEKKLKQRKLKFFKQLKEDKLTDEDLGIDAEAPQLDTHVHVHSHTRSKSSVKPQINSLIDPLSSPLVSPAAAKKKGKEKRNAQGETEEEHHNRVIAEARYESSQAFVSFLTEVRYKNHVKQDEKFVKIENSCEEEKSLPALQPALNKVPSFFHLGVDDNIANFWDDRSMPKAIGQRPNPNQPKYVRSVNTRRGPLVEEIELDELKMPAKPKKKSAEEIQKEEKFKKLVTTALRRKSTIGRSSSSSSNGSQGSSRGRLGIGDLLDIHGNLTLPEGYSRAAPPLEPSPKPKITSMRALVDEAMHAHEHHDDADESTLPSILEQTKSPMEPIQKETSRKVRRREVPKTTTLPAGVFGPGIERPKPKPKPKPKGNAKARSQKFRPHPDMAISASAPALEKSRSAGSPIRRELIEQVPIVSPPKVESKFHKIYAKAGFFPGVMETLKTHKVVAPVAAATENVPEVESSIKTETKTKTETETETEAGAGAEAEIRAGNIDAGDDYGDDDFDDPEPSPDTITKSHLHSQSQSHALSLSLGLGLGIGPQPLPVDKHKLRPEHTSYQVNTPERDFTEDGLLTSRTNNNMHPPTKFEFMNFPGMVPLEDEGRDKIGESVIASCDEQEFQKMWFNAENVEFVSDASLHEGDDFEFDEDSKKIPQSSPSARGGGAILEKHPSNGEGEFASISGAALTTRAQSRGGSRPGSRNTSNSDNIRLISGKGLGSREGSRSHSRSGSRSGSRHGNSMSFRDRNYSPTKGVIELEKHKEYDGEQNF